MSLGDLKLEDLKLSADELRKCRSCSKKLSDGISHLLKSRASTVDHLGHIVEKLKEMEIVSNLVTIVGTITSLCGISQSDVKTEELGGVISNASKVIRLINSQMKIVEAMHAVDNDNRDQQLSGASDSEIFNAVNDKIVEAIKGRQGQFEIQNAWFKEGEQCDSTCIHI